MNNPIIFGLAFGLTLTMVVIGLALMRHAKREEKLRDRLRMANGTYVAKAGQASAGPQAGAAAATDSNHVLQGMIPISRVIQRT